eukprot:CAMPEP_0172186170 /NCGR_PEP_ID=MMETSP1050-20130122/20601_1 /TAXON_ID=233186 /ORGANISM="Cryptomonas curvata, Strain CCAP979/52" /LENGTH=128 /DNA_ID=CAMNT_0012860287 /DNA_START=431 /DNA_END=814 /DNA_ORIENTATION=+
MFPPPGALRSWMSGHFNDTDPNSQWVPKRGENAGRYRVLLLPCTTISIPFAWFWAEVCGLLDSGRHTRTPGLVCGTGTAALEALVRGDASAGETTLATSEAATGDAGQLPHQGKTVKLLGISEGALRW